jgi:hypothetical protein
MAGLPIVITPDDDRHYDIRQGDALAVGLAFDEMLGTIATLTHPEITKGLYGMPKPPRPAPDGETRIVVSLSVEEAQRVSESMADLLCWARGFRAARPDDSDAHPLGVEGLRDLRIKLRRAIGEATGHAVEADLPF